MGGVLAHIKAFKPHPFPHQSDVFTKSVGPASGAAGRALGVGVWTRWAADRLPPGTIMAGLHSPCFLLGLRSVDGWLLLPELY